VKLSAWRSKSLRSRLPIVSPVSTAARLNLTRFLRCKALSFVVVLLHCTDHFAVDAIAIPLLIGFGFALGYGVREIISRYRRREAARRRQTMIGPY